MHFQTPFICENGNFNPSCFRQYPRPPLITWSVSQENYFIRIILLAIRTFKKSKNAIVIQPCKEHEYKHSTARAHKRKRDKD